MGAGQFVEFAFLLKQAKPKCPYVQIMFIGSWLFYLGEVGENLFVNARVVLSDKVKNE